MDVTLKIGLDYSHQTAQINVLGNQTLALQALLSLLACTGLRTLYTSHSPHVTPLVAGHVVTPSPESDWAHTSGLSLSLSQSTARVTAF